MTQPDRPAVTAEDDADQPNAAVRTKDAALGRWQQLQADHRWIRRVIAAYGLLTRTNGNQYAAAITYFSFLALFPLLLLAVAVVGYVLYNQPGLQNSLFSRITDSIPGPLGSTFKQALQAAIANRTSVGIVGLVGVLLTGLGWIGNLRMAIDAVYQQRPPKRNFILSRVDNLLVLGGLGLGIIVSLGLTIVGTATTDQLLNAIHLSSVPGSFVLLKIIGIAVAAAADVVLFWWLLVRTPKVDVPNKVAFQGALMASIGFEILKIVGTYTVAHTANSKTAGPFAGILAVLIWIQLVSRFLLFCCAWIATVNGESRSANSIPVIEPPAMAGRSHDPDAPTVTPAAVGATLVGAGAVAGAVGYWAATRPRPGDDGAQRPRPSRRLRGRRRRWVSR